MNERDTHFQNFAKLLVQEIDEQVGAVTAWAVEHDIDDVAKIGQELYTRWQTLIAQRAYDLMYHARLHTGYGMDLLDINGWIAEDVPDLTEWPRTQ